MSILSLRGKNNPSIQADPSRVPRPQDGDVRVRSRVESSQPTPQLPPRAQVVVPGGGHAPAPGRPGAVGTPDVRVKPTRMGDRDAIAHAKQAFQRPARTRAETVQDIRALRQWARGEGSGLINERQLQDGLRQLNLSAEWSLAIGKAYGGALPGNMVVDLRHKRARLGRIQDGPVRNREVVEELMRIARRGHSLTKVIGP